MNAPPSPAAAAAIAALQHLAAALGAGAEGPIHSAFMEVERALERAPAAQADRAAIDAALDSELVAKVVEPNDVNACVLAAVEILVLGWSLRGSSASPQAHQRLFGAAPEREADLARLREQVVARLTDSGDAASLSIFLLERAGRVENQQRVPLWDHETADEVLAASAAQCCRQFARRRTMFAAERLTRLPDTLEGRMHEAGVFDLLLDRHDANTPLLRSQLQAYGYLERASVWQRLRTWFVGGLRRVLRATAGERWAYEWTQGPGRLAAQWAAMGFIALIAALGLVAITQWHALRRDHLERDLRRVSGLLADEHEAIAAEVTSIWAELEAMKESP